MRPEHILPATLIFAGLLVAALAIPMLLGKVRRNSYYGFRTKLTLSSDEIWYPANRHAARGLIAWGILNITAGIAALFYVPLSDRSQLLLSLAPLSIFIPCLWTMAWVRLRFGVPSLK